MAYHSDPNAHLDVAGVAIDPQNIDGAADVEGTVFDRDASKLPLFALFTIALAATTDAGDTATVVVQESATGDFSGEEEAVTDASVTVTHADKVKHIALDLNPRKRYLRLFADDASITAATNFDICATFVAGAAKETTEIATLVR